MAKYVKVNLFPGCQMAFDCGYYRGALQQDKMNCHRHAILCFETYQVLFKRLNRFVDFR